MSDNIQDRIAAIVRDHDCAYEWGGPDWFCGADSCRESGNDWDDYADHIAAVLVTELGMTKEIESYAVPDSTSHRYVTRWVEGR